MPVVEAVAHRRARDGGAAERRCRWPPARARRATTGVDHLQWADAASTRFRRVGQVSLGRFQEWLGRAVRQPLTGLPILALVLYVTYLFVGVFGAQTLVGLLENGLFGAYINPAAVALASHIPVAFARDFFVGEYGLVTMGLTYAIAIVLPVVTTFFLVFGFLEDSGYIPRLAIFSDRLFRSMGLNGKAVLPMVLGLGCDTMATMTTRILGTPKERLIAITLLALGVPCSAQLATIMGILGGISVCGAADALHRRAVADGLRRLPGGAGAARRPLGLHPGAAADPPAEARQPAAQDALRVRWYLGEAVPLFLLGTALLFVLDRSARWPGCRRRRGRW